MFAGKLDFSVSKIIHHESTPPCMRRSLPSPPKRRQLPLHALFFASLRGPSSRTTLAAQSRYEWRVRDAVEGALLQIDPCRLQLLPHSNKILHRDINHCLSYSHTSRYSGGSGGRSSGHRVRVDRLTYSRRCRVMSKQSLPDHVLIFGLW